MGSFLIIGGVLTNLAAVELQVWLCEVASYSLQVAFIMAETSAFTNPIRNTSFWDHDRSEENCTIGLLAKLHDTSYEIKGIVIAAGAMDKRWQT